MRLPLLRLTLATFGLLAPSVAMADPVAGPRFVELFHSIDSFSNTARSHFANADLDGDGIKDLVFTGDSVGDTLFVVGKKDDGRFGFKQADVLVGNVSTVRILSWESIAGPHVLVVGRGGEVLDYAGWPLKFQRQFYVASDVLAAAIGDIDGDGSCELLVLTSLALNAYSAGDGQLRWSEPLQGKVELALAQLDADPALEIILGGSAPGIVLDGATRARDWEYSEGFGSKLAVGHLAPGGGQKWVSANQLSPFTVFKAAPWSPLWSGNVSPYLAVLATADIDSNGRDVILQGDHEYGGVHVIDSVTRLERFVIPNEGRYINAVVATDLDGDGSKDIVAATTADRHTEPALTIADSLFGAVKWIYFPPGRPFNASGIADIDGDGNAEIVAAAGSRSGYDYGTVEITDASTGNPEWRSPRYVSSFNEPFDMTVTNIAFRDRPSGFGKDIILAGSSYHSGRIAILDGVTKDVVLQLGEYGDGPLMHRRIRGLLAYDYNHDGIDDFVVASQASTTGSQGARLDVFSGTDGVALWTSATMGTGFDWINDVLLADPPNGQSGKELVAVLPGSLQAYSLDSGLPIWTLAVPNTGAAYIRNGVAGPELAVFDDSGLHFYDATTQAWLRDVNLPYLHAVTPLNGNVHQLVADANGRIVLLDGESGVLNAETPFLGWVSRGGKASTYRDGNSGIITAFGTELGLYRHRLELTDRLLETGFEDF